MVYFKLFLVALLIRGHTSSYGRSYGRSVLQVADEPDPYCTFDVLSVDHSSGGDGKYFNFDTKTVGKILGKTLESGNHKVFNSRTGNIESVRMWPNPNGGSIGDGHGRIDPSTNAKEGDWQKGDILAFVTDSSIFFQCATPSPLQIPPKIPSETDKNDICRPAYGRGVVPPNCPDGYPEVDGSLCYPLCNSGYNGVGPVCWVNCKSDEIDDGAFCRTPEILELKGTYGRGSGVIPNSCGNKQYDDGLCYNYCGSGYYGVGPVCWQSCPSGYADHGATCYKHLFDFFGKSSYGRGVGSIPNVCPGNKPDYDAGLCYINCQSGYYGIGPVCWEYCTNGVDIGVSCRTQELEIYAKDSYERGVGVIKNKCDDGYVNDAGLCYKACEPDDIWDGVGPVCWNKNFGTSLGVIFGSLPTVIPTITTCSSVILPGLLIVNAITAETMKTVDFSAFTNCLQGALAVLNGIDDEWDINKIAIALEISGGVKSPGVGVQGIGGIAFTFPAQDKADIYVYGAYCNHFTIDLGIGIQASLVLYRNIDEIPGLDTYFGVGVDVPGTEIGVDISYGFNSECDVTSIAVSVGFGASALPFDIEGGVCISSELEFVDSISTRRRLIDDGYNNNNYKPLSMEVPHSKCFKKLESSYYPRCHSVMSVNKMKMSVYQKMCLLIPECIGFVYNEKINRAQILTLLECPINNIEWYDDNDNEEFYINTCTEEEKDRFYQLLNPKQLQHKIKSGKFINQYYAKCPFDIQVEVKINLLVETQPVPSDNWYNIFTFDANGNIPYPGLFINYNSNQYKLQIGNNIQCISRPIKSNNNDINVFKISIKCNGKSSLSINNNLLLCETNKYNIFDIESSEGRVVTIFASDSSYLGTNGNILSVKATKPAYPWNGEIIADDYDNYDNIIFKTVSGREYLLNTENILTAPFLKFSGNYLIKTDVFLKLDVNEWTEKKYNIFEIGFDDDLDVTTNDIILNYDDDKIYGLMLGISTSDETVKFCYEGNKYFNKNNWNEIKIFIQYTKATLIVNNYESCFIDLSQTPINTHQQMVPLIFASTRFNPIKGLFRNVIIRNNVNKVKSISTSAVEQLNSNKDLSSSVEWMILCVSLLLINIILVYLTCFYKNKNTGYKAVKYLSETEVESV